MQNTYEIIDSRVEDPDEPEYASPYEITAVVTLRRDDGVTADVWLAAGIPDWRRGEYNNLTHNGTRGVAGAIDTYSDTWPVGDSLDCWCPAEFEDDYKQALAAASPAALRLWFDTGCDTRRNAAAEGKVSSRG